MSAPAADTSLLPAGGRIGSYDLISRIAEGGMGAVYDVEHRVAKAAAGPLKIVRRPLATVVIGGPDDDPAGPRLRRRARSRTRRGQGARRLTMWLFVALVVGLGRFAAASNITCTGVLAPGLGGQLAH